MSVVQTGACTCCSDILRRAEEIRRRNRYSRSAIAAMVGVNESTVYRWENGEYKPSGVPGRKYLALLGDLDRA